MLEDIPLNAGNYYLAVTKNTIGTGVGSYSFSIDFTAETAINTENPANADNAGNTNNAANQGVQNSANELVKPVITSAKNSAGKSMVIQWNKVNDAAGYVLQYSTSKKFNGAISQKKIAASKTNVKCSKLKKGKKYYVRMCSYKIVDGEEQYSPWSAKKLVKIKK